MSVAGRKSKYETHVKPYLKKIVQLKRDGIKEYDICKELGVSVASFETYKTKYPELLEAIRDGDRVIADVAEQSLFNIIQGHYVEDTKTIIETFDNKTRKKVEKNKRWVEPQAGAVIFTLRNKMPEEYKEKKHTEISGAIETKNPFNELSVEELKKLAKLADEDE